MTTLRTTQKSESAFREAEGLIPGGVNSPVRAFKSVGGTPRFIDRGLGSKIYDIDDREYIDYVLSWGPLLLGHADADVVKAVKNAADRGATFGAPTLLETELAKLVRDFIPSMEKIRFVTSGTEAAMSAIRLARGFTGRKYIVKFDGCYHGHGDSFLIKAGSGSLTLGVPSSPGVPEEITQLTMSLPFNSAECVRKIFEEKGRDIAAVIVEPVCGNMGVILPKDGFLEELRAVTKEYESVLIFDEVMTGFRVAPGGAQQKYGVIADLVCLGKVIGGGLPVGAYGGRKDIMDMVAPTGPVYQAGTLAGNPIAMAAGIETLKKLQSTDAYSKAEYACRVLAGGIEMHLKKLNKPWKIVSAGTMFTLFFADLAPTGYDEVKKCHTDVFAKFFHGLLDRGVYIAPSQFEACFTSSAHTSSDLEISLKAIYDSLASI